ncbi:MAG: hypothetical protein COX62_04165 [Deltaproteobacteria bacterium CG_4_10_14_0_2_um_filter_43_8]|nr:MAG: hypothetical protein COV43_06425 [Deltaproteobacteria bacterium CG11_big_fil_rev_8_21_14_0_20_42_23]PJA20722.1 MAG: hypothetical protein COX62_04165 [Deltaproteobacteria bacterium CG_4_10_14_0_2_um_filter_43_8]PJC63393.1 MAG: hypothetical protein CO021_09740 [Deltaproteobacteria bacterium CG_4_9_14_0_2_um_filter_42_21]
MQKLAQKNFRWILLAAWLCSSAALVCASVCQASESLETSTHSCCENQQEEQTEPQTQKSNCTHNSDQFFQAFSEVNSLQHFTLLGFATILFSSLDVQVVKQNFFTSEHERFHSSSAPPLYLIKNVFTI